MTDGREHPPPPAFVLARGQAWEGQWCLSGVPRRAVLAEIRSESPGFGVSVWKGSKDAELGSAVSKGSAAF